MIRGINASGMRSAQSSSISFLSCYLGLQTAGSLWTRGVSEYTVWTPLQIETFPWYISLQLVLFLEGRKIRVIISKVWAWGKINVSLAAAPRRALVRWPTAMEGLGKWILLFSLSQKPGDLRSPAMGLPSRVAGVEHSSNLDWLLRSQPTSVERGRLDDRPRQTNCHRYIHKHREGHKINVFLFRPKANGFYGCNLP